MAEIRSETALRIITSFFSLIMGRRQPGLLKHRALKLLLMLLPAILSPFLLEAKSASDVYEQTSKCVVVVYNLDDKGNRQLFASGVVMPDGNVATSNHVIAKAAGLSVVYNGKAFKARIRQSDPEMDISILEVPDLKAPKALIGKNNQLKIGARVYAIGAPRGLELALSEGIVSGFREVGGRHYIQTTAPISSGSSGGGLFDAEGLLVGFPTYHLTEGQQLNFAVPVEWVLELQKRQENNSTNKQNRAAGH